MCDLPSLNITVGETPDNDIFDIIGQIRPLWNRTGVVIKELDEGDVNTIYTVRKADDSQQDDIILIRVNGDGADSLMDRDKEVLVMRIIHQAGLGAELYCRFNNGLAYEFRRGRSLGKEDIANDSVARAIAKKLARMHHLDVKESLIQIGQKNKIEEFSRAATATEHISGLQMASHSVPNVTDDPLKEKILRAEFADDAEVMSEIQRLERDFMAMGFEYSLCHSDLNWANIIVETHSSEIHVIDWEFAGIGWAPKDIGSYLAGMCCLDDCATESLKLYPGKDYQLKWIRWYLEYIAELQGGNDPEGVKEEEVSRIYRGSILCSLVYTQIAARFFLLQDSLSKSNTQAFRKARHYQALFRMIKEDYYKGETEN